MSTNGAQVPPHSLEHEQIVVGTGLAYPEKLIDLREAYRPRRFLPAAASRNLAGAHTSRRQGLAHRSADRRR